MTETTRATAQWGALEEWSSTAFLVGGILWLIDTGLLGLELFIGVSILGTPGMVNPLLYLSGLVAAIVGLLGFYPALASWMPRLARVSAGLVSIAGIAILVLLMWFVTSDFLNQPDPPVVLLLLSLLVVVLGFILFGFASIRTNVPSRTVGLLVLAIPAILFVLIVGTAVSGGDAPDWASPAIGGVMSVLLLAIGYQLRSESATPDREKAESASREVPP